MKRWRHEGDELCDEVVRILDLKPGQDGLQKLLDRLETGKAEEPITRFWDEVSVHPISRVGLMIDLKRTSAGRYCLPASIAWFSLD